MMMMELLLEHCDSGQAKDMAKCHGSPVCCGRDKAEHWSRDRVVGWLSPHGHNPAQIFSQFGPHMACPKQD